MSRTMKRVILKEEVSSGINASDKDLLQDEGFFDAWLEKSISQKDQVTFQGESLHGLFFPSWMEESADLNNYDHALVNNVGYTNNLTYTDDIQKILASQINEGDLRESPATDGVYTIEEVMQESPLGSPISSNDELSYESLEELLNGIVPSDDFPDQMSPVSNSTNEDISMTDPFMDSVPAASPMSDSGVSSLGSCSPAINADLIAELLEQENLDFDLSQSDNRLDDIINPASSEQDIAAVNLNALARIPPSSPPSMPIKQESPPQPAQKQFTFCVIPLQDSQKMSAPKAINKQRHEPYSTGKESGKGKKKTREQRERKKVQNRDAAIRYRNKKKDELADMFNEAEELETKNKDLRGKVDGLKKEIDYLKELMLDVIKARLSNGTSPALQNADLASLSSTLTKSA